ncbi:phosphopantetheinyl transferase (plasmid) [Legionella adelaidensis]|uniref:Phosphopantetheinyl transferase n=1 Tax=Legionella adelaidensis TaxID=45056 RepID=A0A0W0R4Q0_9GAMM|nr:4'-phosphopantetheinyl transferase superfamily protein [Legionella adelaidensis]KTC66054.1 phosphopantetheinyl transferase [Legionella adelaidensis]VEH85728.1 phosphopantetheinyl transferase [Legionella adelaidensis]
MYYPESPFPSAFSLNPQRIDIWRFSLAELPSQALIVLNNEERDRAKRFHFKHHQRRFIVSRSMLRAILSKYLNLLPSEVIFEYNLHGKPAVKNSPFIQFNLTHSKDLALLAVGKDFPLGIDIEYFSPRPYLGIARNIFSAKETLAIEKENQILQPLSFFHIWTQKEALIKACGLGLSYPTEQFDLPHLPGEEILLIDPKFNLSWKIKTFMPESACSGAICYNPAVERIDYFKATYEDFL